MATNNSCDIATGATNTLLAGQGVGVPPTFSVALPLSVANGGTGIATITGLLSGNGTSSFVGRTITGTANQVTVNNGSGSTANPTLSLPSTIYTNISFDSGANTLSAYSTGTWTPTVIGSLANPTIIYGAQRGVYVKIGQFCFLSALITFSAFSGGNGQLQISGLPFNATGDLCFPLGSANLQNVSYTGNYTCAQIQDAGGTTLIQFTQSAPSSANGDIPTSDFSASSIINFSVCYRTS